METPGRPTESRSRPALGWRAVACVLLAMFALCAGAAAAADASEKKPHPYLDLDIAQFHHTAWTVKEGAPGQITALAQSRDGFLWLATQTGLFRFDGVRFERFAPRGADAFPTESVASLFAPESGGLWIGFRYGVVSFVDAGTVRHYTDDEGLPTGSVYGFAQDRSGAVWAASYQGLVRFDGKRWQTLDAAWKYPGKQARSVFVDRDGSLWVATESALARLPHGATKFIALPARVGRISQIVQAPDGTIWIAEADGAVRPMWRDGREAAPDAPRLHIASAGLLFDRHGSLWATSLGEGIRRIAVPSSVDAEPVQRFREDDGLTSDYLWPALQDREGNLWFGTSRGLDRFRRSNVTQAPFPNGSYDFAIAAGDDGSLWAGSKNRPLMQLVNGALRYDSVPPAITSAMRDRHGAVWFGGPRGVWRVAQSKLEHVAALPEAVDYSGVQALALDSAGTLWVSLNQPGVFRWRDGQWNHLDDHPLFPTGSSPLTLLADGDALWLGFARNRLLRLQGDAAAAYSIDDGLDVGNVTAVARAAGALWIGGERGLGFFDAERIRMLPGDADAPLRGITGIVADDDGGLWSNGARGVVHLAPADVAAALQGKSVKYEVFDYLDGMPGTPAQLRPLASAVRATDGRLWFATSSGVVSIDPRQVQRNPVVPPVVIRSVVANATTLPASDVVRLPAHTTSLEIDYTALSLSIPERVRFRYRLDGLDEAWQDVGARRNAFYTNPGPGHYRFRVIAANDDGVWNEQGAAIDIEIAPRFHQTTWFAALCALAILALLRLFHERRTAQISASLRARLQERHRERERIARELHDTLLQGFQGLILRFQSIADRVEPASPLRPALDSALDRAEQVLVEGRDRVGELRTHGGGDGDLQAALLQLGEELGVGQQVEFRVGVSGKPRPLGPLARDEVYRIGREAVFNAFQHAGARRIEVELACSADEFVLSVRDDGRGIDQATLQAGDKPGHWGLRGMRERAQQVNGKLELWTRADSGTEVSLRVPAAIAFGDGGAKASLMTRLRRLLRRR